MSTATITMDPTPTLFKYLLMDGVSVAGPVGGLWTITAPVAQPVLDAARDAVLAFAEEIANKVLLLGVAESAIDTNIAFLASFDITADDAGTVAMTELVEVVKQSTAALRVLTGRLEDVSGAT